MTEESSKEKYIICARCKCKYINDEAHIKTDFEYNRLGEHFKTCVKCRDQCRKNNKYVECNICGKRVTKSSYNRHRMSSQRCIDWEADKRKHVESEPYHPPIIKDNSYELVGEDRYYGGNVLHKDLIPSTTWFNNVRSCISSYSWDKLRHKIYERVDYKCECCGIDCKNNRLYEPPEFVTETINASSSDFDGEIERNKWNTIRIEAHERWQYDFLNQVQKLVRIVALCHRCHTSTHMGLANLRGLHRLAYEHMKKVNNWDDKKLEQDCKERSDLYRRASLVNWKLNIDIITNSGYELSDKVKVKTNKF